MYTVKNIVLIPLALFFFSGCAYNTNTPTNTNVAENPGSPVFNVKTNNPDENNFSTGFIILKNNVAVQNIQVEMLSQIHSQYSMEKNHYVEIIQAEIGGYFPFPIHGMTWRINKKTLNVEKIGYFTDISDDESLGVHFSDKKIIITDLQTSEKFTYPFSFNSSEIGVGLTDSEANESWGEAIFSPDNQLIAFSVLKTGGANFLEESSIVILNRKNGQFTELIGEEGVIVSKKWISNEELLYGPSFSDSHKKIQVNIR